MFEGKTLIGVGCSHVFGEYMGDVNPETCHQRSWVKKLEKLGNFKNSVNLGTAGGSNIRSERVLFEYLKNNDTDNLVVIFSITELSRTEFVDVYNIQSDKFFKIGSWMGNKDVATNTSQRVKEFVETYYGQYHDDEHDINENNRKILMIHLLLKSLNIEHYFFEMLNVPGKLEESQFNFQLPSIPFRHHNGTRLNANGFMRYKNQKPGTCNHWDHEGNEFLANYLLKQIKEFRNE
jgi:hypothetical protein